MDEEKFVSCAFLPSVVVPSPPCLLALLVVPVAPGGLGPKFLTSRLLENFASSNLSPLFIIFYAVLVFVFVWSSVVFFRLFCRYVKDAAKGRWQGCPDWVRRLRMGDFKTCDGRMVANMVWITGGLNDT